MDGNAAVERGREALKRILSALFAMAGLGRAELQGDPRSTLPRIRHRAILRLLRPAESAARRLIITLGMTMPPPPPRFARSPSPATQGRSLGRGRPRRGSSSVYGGGVAASDGGGVLPPRQIVLPLFDRLRRFSPRRPSLSSLPRICVPGLTERLPVPVRHEPLPYDPIDATRLALRLDALSRALDDLPAQARRFALWKSRRAFARNEPVATRRKTQRLWPLRMGRPPGANRRATHEVHEILNHAHELAWWALERRDTS